MKSVASNYEAMSQSALWHCVAWPSALIESSSDRNAVRIRQQIAPNLYRKIGLHAIAIAHRVEVNAASYRLASSHVRKYIVCDDCMESRSIVLNSCAIGKVVATNHGISDIRAQRQK